MNRGLSRVPSESLEGLLRAIYHGRVTFPLQRQTLMAMGMNRLADNADLLVGLDEKGVRAVIAAVIAERRQSALPRSPASG